MTFPTSQDSPFFKPTIPISIEPLAYEGLPLISLLLHHLGRLNHNSLKGTAEQLKPLCDGGDVIGQLLAEDALSLAINDCQKAVGRFRSTVSSGTS